MRLRIEKKRGCEGNLPNEILDKGIPRLDYPYPQSPGVGFLDRDEIFLASFESSDATTAMPNKN